jgi:hypothetical protein
VGHRHFSPPVEGQNTNNNWSAGKPNRPDHQWRQVGAGLRLVEWSLEEDLQNAARDGECAPLLLSESQPTRPRSLG